MRIVGFREKFVQQGLVVIFVVANNGNKHIWVNREIDVEGYIPGVEPEKYRAKLELEQRDLHIAPGCNKQFLTKRVFDKWYPFLLFKIYKINKKKVRLLHTDSGVVGFWRFYWNNDIKRDELIARVFYKIREFHDKCKKLLYKLQTLIRILKYKWKESVKEWEIKLRMIE